MKDVLPALETNSVGLKKVLDELVKQYKRQQEEMEKWKVSVYSILATLVSKYATGFPALDAADNLNHRTKLTIIGK